MQENISNFIGAPFEGSSIIFRVHATQRMFKRGFDEKDVHHLLATGTIIETYMEDYPFPSVLIKAISRNQRLLHAAVGIDFEAKQLFVITMYEPDPAKWSDNYAKRCF